MDVKSIISDIWYHFTQAVKKTFVLEGRSRRKEYWYLTLVSWFISNLATFIMPPDISSLSNILTILVIVLVSIFLFITSLTCMFRRLHDSGRSAWWSIVPLYNLWLLTRDSEPGKNEYGDNPKPDVN